VKLYKDNQVAGFAEWDPLVTEVINIVIVTPLFWYAGDSLSLSRLRTSSVWRARTSKVWKERSQS
jgi:hypothetical protein